MPERRSPGTVKLNGIPYRVSKGQNGQYLYQSQFLPKFNPSASHPNVSVGKSNLLEFRWGMSQGMGDSRLTTGKDTYHYAQNMYMEREGEAVMLPSALEVVQSPVGQTFPLTGGAPVWVGDLNGLSYVLQDQRLFVSRDPANVTPAISNSQFRLFPVFTFETTARPTYAVAFNDLLWIACGASGDSRDRYLRRFNPTDNTVSRDDNNPFSITTAADNGSGGTRFTVSTATTYATGDNVLLSGFTANAAYNGLWKGITVIDSTHFDVTVPFGTAETGTVNRQDSDAKAEYLTIVGDLMLRAYKDPDIGWATARVDPVGSDPLVEANWTAGIGTLGVGDPNEPITSIVAVANGEVVMKSEGIYTYDTNAAAYLNQAPELLKHKHPDNGKNSFYWKGWVYVPTIVGLLRYRNGVIQDVTPGRYGTQEWDTPVGPIAAITGDAVRLYAITRPFKINMPVWSDVNADLAVEVVTDAFDEGVFVNNTDVVDGNPDTFLSTNSVYGTVLGTFQGHIYVGCKEPFHRIHVELAPPVLGEWTPPDATTTMNVEYWNGSGWVQFGKPIGDYTTGRLSSADHTTTLFQTGDITWTNIPNNWALAAPNLDSTMYWVRLQPSQFPGDINIEEFMVGPHVAGSTLAFNDSTENNTDHGGVVYVLSAKEVPNVGMVWNTLWAFNEPTNQDSLIPAPNGTNWHGGAQPVGYSSIVLPKDFRSWITGDRFLYVGMFNVSYLCPLGNKSDPTVRAPFTPKLGLSASGETLANILVLPDTDMGMPKTPKALHDLDFDLYSAIGTSEINAALTDGLTVFYRVDFGDWVKLTQLTSVAANRPWRFARGSEPVGKTFGIAFVYCAPNNVQEAWDLRIMNPRISAQPKPKMRELITMTVELDVDNTLFAGYTTRTEAMAQWANLKALCNPAITSVSVPFVHFDGSTTYNVDVLQVTQRVSFNGDELPTLVADIIMAEVPDVNAGVNFD